MHEALRRTIVFALSVTALLIGARGGAPQARVLVLFVIFAITASVWVRGQYADSLDGIQWLLPWQWATGFCVISIPLVAIFIVTRREGFGLSGLILLYFGVGSLVMRWRQNPTNHRTWGIGLLVAGLIAGSIGAAQLGNLSGWLPLGLLVLALLVLLPLAFALLSEWAIERLSYTENSLFVWRFGVGLGGAFLFFLMSAASVHWAGSRWVLLFMVGLGLVVWALASTTQADIVAVLAVLALMGVTPLHARHPEALEPGGGSKVLVALGDSYMSGEGASIYYEGTDEGGVNTCRRSPTSWAAMAGQQRPFDRLAFLACSGARTANVRTDETSEPVPTAQKGEPGTQLARYRELLADKHFTPALVVLSIGGNDAGFSTIGLMCLAPGNCHKEQGLWNGGLDQVEALLRGTYAEVRDEFSSTPVVVTAYPDPIDMTVDKCGEVALSMRERMFLTEFLHKLNARVRKVAAEFRFYYMSSMERSLATAHLQLCDPLNDGRPGLNFIGLRSVNGIAEQRFSPTNWSHSSLHPNERGHAAMLRVFQDWISDQGGLETLPVMAPKPPADAGKTGLGSNDVSLQEPPCDLFDSSPSGCRPRGQRWVEQQVGALFLSKGWLGLLAALGAWAASVAFFGWRRRRARN